MAVFLGYNQYWPGGFLLFVVLCPGAPEGSAGGGSGFKASQKTGHCLKSHPADWEKLGIELATRKTKLFVAFRGYKPVLPGWFHDGDT